MREPWGRHATPDRPSATTFETSHAQRVVYLQMKFVLEISQSVLE